MSVGGGGGGGRGEGEQNTGQTVEIVSCQLVPPICFGRGEGGEEKALGVSPVMGSPDFHSRFIYLDR